MKAEPAPLVPDSDHLGGTITNMRIVIRKAPQAGGRNLVGETCTAESLALNLDTESGGAVWKGTVHCGGASYSLRYVRFDLPDGLASVPLADSLSDDAERDRPIVERLPSGTRATARFKGPNEVFSEPTSCDVMTAGPAASPTWTGTFRCGETRREGVAVLSDVVLPERLQDALPGRTPFRVIRSAFGSLEGQVCLSKHDLEPGADRDTWFAATLLCANGDTVTLDGVDGRMAVTPAGAFVGIASAPGEPDEDGLPPELAPDVAGRVDASLAESRKVVAAAKRTEGAEGGAPMSATLLALRPLSHKARRQHKPGTRLRMEVRGVLRDCAADRVVHEDFPGVVHGDFMCDALKGEPSHIEHVTGVFRLSGKHLPLCPEP